MENYDYYNTWQAQNTIGYSKNIINRDYLNEEIIFGKDGLINLYPTIRKNLYFIIDDGFDVNYSYNVKEDYPFASHILRDDRFPSFKGSPQEKLKQLSSKVKSYGWKGLGIWVCAQGYGNDYFKSVKGLRKFFKERLEWSKYALISYWKVDWGKYGNDSSFRVMLTNLAKKIYPELIIENAYCMSPVNGYKREEEPGLEYRYPWNKEMKDYIDKVVSISKIFRSYDVTNELSFITTLERVCYLLKNKKTLINIEDEPYLGAILGCPIGIQRNINSALFFNKDKISYHFKCNEILATINYREYSSCFVGKKIYTSKNELEASNQFESYWCKECDNENVKQIAPAIVSRNTKLAKVKTFKNYQTPFVVSCLDLNNNYSIGTFKKLNYEEDKTYKVNISTSLKNIPSRIAIFSNHIKKFKIRLTDIIDNYSFKIVNLFNLEKINCIDAITINKNYLNIDCSKIIVNNEPNDYSTKAFMIEIIKN